MSDPNFRLVSVIVPAWNAAPWIESTLRAVLDQTWTGLEVLVADDGSTDATTSIVERMASLDSRLRLIAGPHCGHPGAVRNRALAEARGGCIALLDADDLWVATKIEDQLADLGAHPGADLIVTSARFLQPDHPVPPLQRPLPPRDASPALRAPDCSPEAAFALLVTRRRTIHTSSVLMTRALLEHIGPFSEDPRLRSGQDDDFIFRAWRRGHPRALAPVYVHARRRAASVSAENSWENIFALIEAARDRGDLEPALASRAWSAAWTVRGERGLRDAEAPWRAAMLRAWRLDPFNPRRLPALFSPLLPKPWARRGYDALRGMVHPGER